MKKRRKGFVFHLFYFLLLSLFSLFHRSGSLSSSSSIRLCEMLKLIRVYQLFVGFLVIAFVILSVFAGELKGFITLSLSTEIVCLLFASDLRSIFGWDCSRQLDFLIWIKLSVFFFNSVFFVIRFVSLS